MKRSITPLVATVGAVVVLAGCDAPAAAPVRTPMATPTAHPTSTSARAVPSRPGKVVVYDGPPGSEGALVRRYLDAVVAGRCWLARTMMVSPAIADSAGRPSADARKGNGLCGRSKVGRLTIDGWAWGDQQTGALGTDVFTAPVILHVTAGRVPPATITDYPVPPGWTAYQLPLYSAMDGHLYVTGAPIR